MSTAEQEPEFLAKITSVQREKRRAARTIHRGVLHHSPDISPDDINQAYSTLSSEEVQKAFTKHANDGHPLGQASERVHAQREPRNWKTKRR